MTRIKDFHRKESDPRVQSGPEFIEPQDTIEAVARICHEANRAFCMVNGDFSQAPWDETPANIRASAINGVLFVKDNPLAGESASHDNWLKFKTEDGWVYGEVKDPEAKTHPCMVPYDQLPAEQQLKDRLFRNIVLAFCNIDPLEADTMPGQETFAEQEARRDAAKQEAKAKQDAELKAKMEAQGFQQTGENTFEDGQMKDRLEQQAAGNPQEGESSEPAPDAAENTDGEQDAGTADETEPGEAEPGEDAGESEEGSEDADEEKSDDKEPQEGQG